MSKKNRTPDAPTATAIPTATATPTVTTAPEATKDLPMPTTETPSTELVPAAAAPTALAAPSTNPMAALAAQLPPEYRDNVLLMKKPSIEELSSILDGVPADKAESIRELLRRMNPRKQGMHSARSNFAPLELKLFHGVGADPMRPDDLPPGHFYASDGSVYGKSFEAVPLGCFEGRNLWPEKDSGQGNAPLCSSVDSKYGTRYGSCESCPRAAKKYTEGGCTKEIVLYVMERKTYAVLAIRLSKTSYGAGTGAQKLLRATSNLWDRFFRFTAEERKESTNRWFVIKVGAATSDASPTANTDKILHPVYEVFSRMLDVEVYYPRLAAIASGRPSDPVEEVSSTRADEEAILKAGAVDDSDFSSPTV